MIPDIIRVLVVDDEAMVGRMLKAFLELKGLLVTTAALGSEALEKMAGGDYHAAIIDMRLPDMTGDELILRAVDVSPGTHFLIHTGSLDYRLSEKLKAIGIAEDDIIQKPVSDMGEIYRAILKAVEKGGR